MTPSTPLGHSPEQAVDAIIIGAGAAGIFTAMQCALLGKSVLLLEKNAKPGLKILVSGGGRCNFTNLGAGPEHYQSENPHFCISALARFSPQDFLATFHTLGLNEVEKKRGQLFCQQGAKAFLDALLKELHQLDVPLLCSHGVEEVEHHPHGSDSGHYLVKTQQGHFWGRHLVLCNGGLAWPKLGANGSGYAIAKTFGHRVTPTRPGLVPLLWPKELQHWSEISGVACPCRLSLIKNKGKTIVFEDDLLFTHWGISGPVVLQASNHWQKEDRVSLDFLPQNSIRTLVQDQQSREQQLGTLLEKHLPKRLVQQLQPKSLKKKLKQLQHKELDECEQLLHHWSFKARDQAGFPKAEVTLGGVDTRDVSSKTLESKRQKGLYFAGEVLDVTGQLGGYNFQWAWASAWSVAQAIPYA